MTNQLNLGRLPVARWHARHRVLGLQDIEQDLPRGTPAVPIDAAKLVELTMQVATHWRCAATRTARRKRWIPRNPV
jgi:hypothetical protein